MNIEGIHSAKNRALMNTIIEAKFNQLTKPFLSLSTKYNMPFVAFLTVWLSVAFIIAGKPCEVESGINTIALLM